MWQSKREISRECNDIFGSAKGSQISEKYWGEVGKGKRADIYLKVRKSHLYFWMKQVPVLWTLFVILHLFWSLQQWDKLTLLHNWKTPPTQQRLKNNKVYECHPDVKFLWEHQQSVNNLLGRFISVKGHLQTFAVS